MSRGERVQATQKLNARRVAVRSIAWLDGSRRIGSEPDKNKDRQGSDQTKEEEIIRTHYLAEAAELLVGGGLILFSPQEAEYR